MRLHLIFAFCTLLLLFLTLRVTERNRFTFHKIQVSAEALSHKTYVPLPNLLPSQLQKLTVEQAKGIFWKEAFRLWRKKGLPFQVDFYPLSNSEKNSPILQVIDGRGEHRLAYSPSYFDYSELHFEPPLPPNLGYAGFYLRYPINRPDALDGFFSVLGMGYFRAFAQDQVYGLSGRALAINTEVMGEKEEFPEFKEWWLHEPEPGATSLVLDALLDSPSVSGAYGFKINPGPVTNIEVHASLFFRKSVQWLGIAPLSSMFLYGPGDGNHWGDSHPAVHDSDGLLLNTGTGDWIWRPLRQASQLQTDNFQEENPRGFGLLQRDRDFQHYQDLVAKYNVRPSVWITPRGKSWGRGEVVLTQMPSNNRNTDNIVLFWHPEHQPLAGDRMELDYTLSFYMNDASRPSLAYTAATFIINPAPPVSLGSELTPMPDRGTTPVQFMIDFAGHGIEDIPATKPPYLHLAFNPPETLLETSNIQKIGYGNSWRVSFTIQPKRHFVPTQLHCRLMSSDRADANPLSEEWTYTWNQ